MATNDYLAAIAIWEKRALKAEKELASGNEMIMNQCYAWMARAEKAEAELEAVKNVLANVKGVANFYNSEHHANYNYEGKVFAKDLNKMLKGKGE